MKNTVTIAFFILVFAGCKKSNNLLLEKTSSGISKVEMFLKDSLQNISLETIDLNHAVRSVLDSGHINFIRIPFKERNIKESFLLINADEKGNCLSGVIVNITNDNKDRINKNLDGTILISSLQQKEIKQHKVINGFIVSKEKNDNSNNFVKVDEGNTLPEVIVVSYIYPTYISWSDWISLMDIYGSTGYDIYGSSTGNGEGTGSSDGGYGYYSPLDPFERFNDDDSDISTDDDIPSDDTRIIEYEPVESLDPISLDSYLKCFSTIADAGSTCSIEIFSDLPVNGEPNTFFDWENGSPGHTFLQIKKSNGTISVQQNIGFYPNQGWKTMLTPAPVTGKFVDNAGHEFNASMKMTLTPEQLQSAINEMLYLKNSIKYDIDENNCTDFALHIFNFVRPGNPVEIPKYDIPGGMAPYGTSTPQGLYQKLSSMKEEGGAEAANINIPGVLGWVGDSNGPCN
ncbi:hypothetical protein FRZ67_19055 [Panacibacter ginsenosidivorans]|uniref:Uncharacterized protein n=1 Tax=Panacibacter ginsenosidivorans TaxID=1813871 RepID=A0A5B8VDB1_9BACT|nr:hypothetical protein [Panacibacter ginsenosidivorans]QEC69302.1 hypothetical protein FRZ67_19055 [Panacibacter ginsenosidivorans]